MLSTEFRSLAVSMLSQKSIAVQYSVLSTQRSFALSTFIPQSPPKIDGITQNREIPRLF